EEQLARIGVKNHTHASKNPNAHFQKGATLAQVLGSRMISSPLRLFMCSPITDGAAAVLIASEDRARSLTDKPVWIRGTAQALGGLIGCGHPLGATGVAQAAEVYAQLRGEAGARQAPNAAIGLTHNNSGMGEHVVMIYGRDAG